MLKKLSAILLCAVIVISFAACGSENGESTTSAAETTADTVTQTATESQTQTTTEPSTEPVTETETETTEETTVETTTETTTQATTAKPTTTKPTTTKPVTTTKKATTTKATTKAATTSKPKPKAPSGKAEIVALYNSATQRVSSAKPGYTKNRVTQLNNLQMGALSRLDVVRTAVGDFMGEGTTKTTVTKGKYKSSDLKVSTLKESDVSAATCTLSSDGKYYDLTITVKNETNLSKKNSAIGRFTDDYKDTEDMKTGMAEGGAGVDSIDLKSTSVVIKAKIDAETKNFVSLSQTLKMSAVFHNVKYSIVKVSSASGELVTQIDYTGFKY